MSIAKPKNHTNSLAALADSSFHYGKELFVSKSWPSFVNFAKYTLLNLLKKVKRGHMRILTQEQIYEFGERLSEDPVVRAKTQNVELKVVDDRFWVRLLLMSDMGFAEAYMNGDVYTDNLVGLVHFFIDNRAALSDMSTIFSPFLNTITYLVTSPWVTNTLSNALSNISAHYDISNEMFAAFLDSTMTYSCAYWTKGTPGSHDTTESLEQAQMNKIRKIIELARIREGDHVLEIGSGWGSLAIEAVRSRKCQVTTLTLSAEQKALAEERIAEAGLSDKIDVLLCDYRSLPREHQFDKIVSCEMIEAVGQQFLDEYFKSCDGLLKLEGEAVAVYQCITMPESRYRNYCRGHCPTLTHILDAARKGSQERLIPHEVQHIGAHYVRTLRLWRENFLANFDAAITPALLNQYPSLSPKEIDIFRRKWEYYFAYCEGGFKTGVLGVQWVVLKREAVRGWVMEDGVPL